MDKKAKKRWVKALRSKNFKQGQQSLCFERDGQYRHCCLGVLAEIEALLKDAPWNTPNSEIRQRQLSYGLPLTNTLNTEILEKYKISEEEHEALWRMNDIERLSFEEIADWIDENL